MTALESADQRGQRIDKWLWCARFFKTRTIAAKFVSDGNIRLTRNGDAMRIQKPSFLVRESDLLVFSRNDHLRIINVTALATRRGPATEAQMLYDDQSPPRSPKTQTAPTNPGREKGAGRPTKKDRRALDALKLN